MSSGIHPSAQKKHPFSQSPLLPLSQSDRLAFRPLNRRAAWRALQPILKVKIVGNKVELDWDWGSNSSYLDQCEIQVDRGQGYKVPTFDTTPGYTDATPFLNAPTKWKYRAICRVDDQQVGQWSAEVSVTVG